MQRSKIVKKNNFKKNFLKKFLNFFKIAPPPPAIVCFLWIESIDRQSVTKIQNLESVNPDEILVWNVFQSVNL